MKKILSILFVGMALISFVACSDSEYDEKYADPSKTSTVGVPQVFTAVMYKGNTWMNPVYYRYYTQSTTSGTFSGIIGNSNGKGRFMGAGEGYFNTRWQNFYDMLTQHRLLEYTYDNLSDEEKTVNEVFYYLSRTLVEAQLHEMLSLFGDVPFSGAGTLWYSDYSTAKEQDVYDDDVTLYKQILVDLKEAGDYFASGNLNATGLASLERQDYSLAAGSSTIWQKYINSLRLRIAIHLATNGDCTTEARSAIAEILNNPATYPLIDDNSENMGVAGDTQTDAFNFGKSISQALRTGSYAAGSQAVLDAMNVPSNGIPGTDTDPRLQVMYDCNPDGEYVAYDVSLTNSQISDISDEKNKEYVARGIKSANYYCEIDSQAIAGYETYQGNSNLDGLWIGAAEVSFNKAEAYLMGYGVSLDETEAKENFINGIKQSTEYYWNLKETSSLYKEGNDSYAGYRSLVKPTDAEIEAYAESIWEPTQEVVCTQLWLNFSFINELEAWNVVRRTGYPVVTFASDTQVSNYPTPPNRLPYPSDELTYNSTNVQEAISKNYEETTGYYTNVFWAKKTYYKLVGE
jgi:hypothetical protein